MIRRIRKYPGESVAKAIARASRKRWWPLRTHDEPSLMPGGLRWYWTTTEAA